MVDDLSGLYNSLSENTCDMEPHINFDALKNELYIESRRKLEYTHWIKLSHFIISVVILLIPFLVSEKLAVSFSWLLVGLIVSLQTYNYRFKSQSKQLYSFAEKIRQHDFLKDIYVGDLDEEEESYLLDNIEQRFIDVSKSSKINDKYIEKEQDLYKKLVLRFQENTFFTYMLHGRYSEHIKNRAFFQLIAIFAFVLSFIIVISLTGFDSQYETLIPSTLGLILSLMFSLDYFSYYSSFRNKSYAIKEIDLKLEKLKYKEDEKEVFALFSQFNCILWDAYPIKQSFFWENVTGLNEIVKGRIKNYKNKQNEQNEQQTH